MLLNGVDIYTCKFFTINQEGKLQFSGGVNKGKTSEDFNNLPELKKAIAYCCWIIGKEDTPWNSKYAASVFMSSLVPKIFKLEKFIKEEALKHQRKMQKETEESIKITGTEYK